jgi:hypothetical protein
VSLSLSRIHQRVVEDAIESLLVVVLIDLSLSRRLEEEYSIRTVLELSDDLSTERDRHNGGAGRRTEDEERKQALGYCFGDSVARRRRRLPYVSSFKSRSTASVS